MYYKILLKSKDIAMQNTDQKKPARYWKRVIMRLPRDRYKSQENMNNDQEFFEAKWRAEEEDQEKPKEQEAQKEKYESSR